jgi:hypothetical protein
MSPDLKQGGEIILDEMLNESTRHVVTRLPSGAVVDSHTNLREKPPQKCESDTLDYGLSRFAAGIEGQRRRLRSIRRHR